jgi:hypothetical protein
MNTPHAPKGQAVAVFIKPINYNNLTIFRMVAPVNALGYGPALPEAGDHAL